jgi:hypothetical protein
MPALFWHKKTMSGENVSHLQWTNTCQIKGSKSPWNIFFCFRCCFLLVLVICMDLNLGVFLNHLKSCPRIGENCVYNSFWHNSCINIEAIIIYQFNSMKSGVSLFGIFQGVVCYKTWHPVLKQIWRNIV